MSEPDPTGTDPDRPGIHLYALDLGADGRWRVLANRARHELTDGFTSNRHEPGFATEAEARRHARSLGARDDQIGPSPGRP